MAQKSLNQFSNFQIFFERLADGWAGDRTQDGTDIMGKNTIFTKIQLVVQQYDNPYELNRAQAQSTEAIMIKVNCDQTKIISNGLDLAGNKLTKESNRVKYSEKTLKASEINFGTDYSCPSSPTVVKIMDSNDDTVDGSKVRGFINYNLIDEEKSELTCGGNDLLVEIKENIGLNISEFQSNPHWISCKITADLIGNTRLNIVLINVHIPSSGIRKKKALESLENHINKIKQLKNQPKILIVGDFNMDIVKSSPQITKLNANLTLESVLNSLGSRKNGVEIGRMIDHIFYSGFYSRPNICKAFLALAQLDSSIGELCTETEMTVMDIMSNFKKDPLIENKKTQRFIEKKSQYFISNKSKKLWSWIKSRIGRGFTLISNGPVLDTGGTLIVEQNQKSLIWTKQFKCLAEDASGNKYIKIAFKSTPNIKVAAIDDIPSEVWKLSKNEQAQEKLKRWATSIVLPAPKKGDLTDSNNY
ncbi:hypothetical protein BB561_000284 [Smittium simulii]|uniref:Endonuclease/exonuclease/phosphatase domain-containing protein n=1 Tax=Smittium simulii TaxID=133385 RepID=A0A2T9YZR8_9FUNG|nr:hypothetical protein BB561_000284 [Smittium simulii]